MCGRYYIKESMEMDEIIRLMNASPLKLALEKRELGVRTYGERFRHIIYFKDIQTAIGSMMLGQTDSLVKQLI